MRRRLLTTYKNLEINMMVDPSATIELPVKAAVRECRWMGIEGSLSGLVENGSGAGPCTEPIWSLLNSKANTEDWNPPQSASLDI